MISQLRGRLRERELDRIEIETAGGVGYEVFIPLGLFERLPAAGEEILVHTHLVVKEDGWQLYGFANATEREIFRRILNAKGVGPALALGMLSTLTAERVLYAIQEKDVALLQTVPRLGRKKAEQILLDLADKFRDLSVGKGGGAVPPGTAGAENAIRALVSLGYGLMDSEKAVRTAIEEGTEATSAAELIKRALALASNMGGRTR